MMKAEWSGQCRRVGYAGESSGFCGGGGNAANGASSMTKQIYQIHPTLTRTEAGAGFSATRWSIWKNSCIRAMWNVQGTVAMAKAIAVGQSWVTRDCSMQASPTRKSLRKRQHLASTKKARARFRHAAVKACIDLGLPSAPAPSSFFLRGMRDFSLYRDEYPACRLSTRFPRW